MVDDDFNGGELVGPVASVVSEDKHTFAVLDVIGGVSVRGDNVVRDDVAVVGERGHHGRAGASVGVGAECENWVNCKQHTCAYLAENGNEWLRTL